MSATVTMPQDQECSNTSASPQIIDPATKGFKAPSSHPYKHLTQSDAEHFLTKGWLLVPNAIKSTYIDKWLADLWTRIDYDPDDKSTWKDEYLHLPRHREVPAEEFCPAAWDKIAELCGGLDRIDPIRERYYGDAFIINFGTAERTKEGVEYKPQDKEGYHADDDWYRMLLDSSGNALTVIHCFSDIPPRGGGTWLCEDGISGVVKYLYDHPEGLDPPIKHMETITAHVPQCNSFHSVTAKKGDVLIMHGLLPHTLSANQLHYARVISNPHDHPFAKRSQQSLLEQVILRGLDRSSVPEYEPTRERRFWYPRNAGFKRAKAEGELKRMVAAAEAKGLPASSVDSIYQRRGTKEFEDFERRNGFDKVVNPVDGLLTEQHSA